MKKEDKNILIESLQKNISAYSHFYLTDIAGLDAQQTSDLRRKCYKSEIRLIVAKNKLLHRVLINLGVSEELFVALKGNTALMLTNISNAPAKLIQDFVKGSKDVDAKPILKAAYVEQTVYVGREHLNVLATLKSKNELIADVVFLLQSPIKNVIGSLQSGGNKIHRILETLEKKNG